MAKVTEQPSRTRNRCVLCGGAPVTRAHVIARRIREVLPTGTTSRDMITRLDFTEPYPRRAKQHTWERGSDVFSVQPRVLCGPCNNHWMSVLEDAAAPVVAAMIVREHPVELDKTTKHQVAEWALAAAIVRGEVASDRLLPIDIDLAQSFRKNGIDGLPVVVAAVNIEKHRQVTAGGEVATSYMHNLDDRFRGHLVLFWLKEVVIVVATHDYARMTAAGLTVIRSAGTQFSPAAGTEVWPPRSSITDLHFLRALQLRVDEMPRQSFDFSRIARGRSTIDAFLLPNTVGQGPAHAAAQQVAAARLAAAQSAKDPS